MELKQADLIKGLQEAYDKHHNDMSESLTKHIESLEDSTGEYIQNIEDVATNQVNNVLEGVNRAAAKMTPKYKTGEEVQYVDEYTGTTCHVEIKQVHMKDDRVQHYTIAFRNGKQKRVFPMELRPTGQDSPYRVLTSKRFPDVQLDPLERSSHVIQHRQQSYTPPSQSDIVQFHKQFKAQLRCDDDIINFFNQLKSQGRSYNILLIELDEIHGENDLCPPDVSVKDRESMSLAIYQKMQDENNRDITYVQLDNCIDQHASTSDGYEVLRELLRRVHPNLNEGKIEHTIPRFSECNNNLYKLNKRMREFFTSEMVNK